MNGQLWGKSIDILNEKVPVSKVIFPRVISESGTKVDGRLENKRPHLSE